MQHNNLTCIHHEVTITLPLMNIHYLIQIQNLKIENKFLWWEILVFNLITTYITHICIMSYITFLILFYLIFKILCLFTTFVRLSLPKPPSCGNKKSNFFFCLFICFKYNRPTTLCYFFWHGIVIQYFYIFWANQHQKSSYDMPACKHIT